MKTKAFDFYSDPGHGWLAVKKTVLGKLGIAALITPYSYQRGDMAFLEEDCDLSTFFKAFKSAHGVDPVIREHSSSRDSRIRGYVSYRAAPHQDRQNGGCGAMTHVEGTNDGMLPCGSLLTRFGKDEPYYCSGCHSRAIKNAAISHEISREVTPRDIESVLQAYSLRVANSRGMSFSAMAEELANEIDQERVRCAAASSNTGTFDEIREILVEMGVLEF
ncbi:MAG: hypothetical protein A2286_00040 [Gammaproteobacteria bacterium RIFOXYA12_FULL_61_12]|nr:MAG: hypothetical protein A2514_11435 [Gammaproteobacteria bacterium RIFOXYD12_FULL_61_37]OGT90757.1 MAG: hypothetical protein A2286_00040 [Gammaproteobacteria bacterium RIFOXYA12_FULL_61_12]